jgi:hypothetical protein
LKLSSIKELTDQERKTNNLSFSDKFNSNVSNELVLNSESTNFSETKLFTSTTPSVNKVSTNLSGKKLAAEKELKKDNLTSSYEAKKNVTSKNVSSSYNPIFTEAKTTSTNIEHSANLSGKKLADDAEYGKKLGSTAAIENKITDAFKHTYASSNTQSTIVTPAESQKSNNLLTSTTLQSHEVATKNLSRHTESHSLQSISSRSSSIHVQKTTAGHSNNKLLTENMQNNNATDSSTIKLSKSEIKENLTNQPFTTNGKDVTGTYINKLNTLQKTTVALQPGEATTLVMVTASQITNKHPKTTPKLPSHIAAQPGEKLPNITSSVKILSTFTTMQHLKTGTEAPTCCNCWLSMYKLDSDCSITQPYMPQKLAMPNS